MTQIMTAPKEMTDGQIEDAVNKLRDAMRKHRSEISSDIAQQVLGTDNLGRVLFAHFRKIAETMSNIIVRRITVNRSLSPEQALEATGRGRYVTNSVVATMPRGDKNEEKVFFVKRDKWTSDADWDAHLDSLGLKPCDPHTLAKVNEDDPVFADDHPNGTHWKDGNGNWCFAAFNHWNGVRYVYVDRYGFDWYGHWWFAGVRK